MRRVLCKDEDIDYEFLVPKKENLDGKQVRLMSCGILSLLLRVFLFSWFPWSVCLPPGFLGYFEDVAPNPRILCFRICEFSSATTCVLSHVFFFCILSSSQDSIHCTLSLTVCKCTPCQRASFNSTTDSFSWGHDPYTLACKARPSFDRCWTSLSVSLSFSLTEWEPKNLAAGQLARLAMSFYGRSVRWVAVLW